MERDSGIPDNEAEQLLGSIFEGDLASQLRLGALDSLERRVRLFLSGVITAEEVGHPGASYGNRGVPCISGELAREIGMLFKPFDKDDP